MIHQLVVFQLLLNRSPCMAYMIYCSHFVGITKLRFPVDNFGTIVGENPDCLSCPPVLCPHDAVCPAGSMRPTQCTSPWRKIEAQEVCVYSETFVMTMCVIAAGKAPNMYKYKEYGRNIKLLGNSFENMNNY